MDLITVHHYEHVGKQSTDRESVYRVHTTNFPTERITSDPSAVRIKVHQDRSYAQQGWAKLELWNGSDFVTLFTAHQGDVFDAAPWETENSLLASFGKFVQSPFSPSDTESALFQSGHLDQ